MYRCSKPFWRIKPTRVNAATIAQIASNTPTPKIGTPPQVYGIRKSSLHMEGGTDAGSRGQGMKKRIPT